MTLRRSFSIVLLLTGLAAGTHSQAVLTLEQSLRLARENSPALHTADNAIRSSGLAGAELTASTLPQVRAVAGASYAPIPPTFGYDAAISNGGQIAGQIILQQSLYDGGVRGVKFDQLRLDADRLDRERRRVDRDLTLEVKQSFVEVLRAERERTLQMHSVGQLETWLDLVRQLYSGGKANYTDVLKTELQLSRATLALQKAGESLAVARYALSAVMGIAIDSTVVIVGSLDTPSAGPADSLAIDHSTNLDLAVADLGVRRTLLDVDVIHREQWPSISLFGDAGYLSSIENLRLPSTERVRALGFSVGVTVEMPLLTWGATGLRAEQRQLEAEALRQQAELQRRSIIGDLRKTQLELANARSQLQAVRGNVVKAEENFLLTRSIFAGGATISLEVLTAQQLLTETQLAELETLASIQFLTAKLDYYATR